MLKDLRIYVKRSKFLSVTRNTGTHANKNAKDLSNKYSKKFLDGAEKSTTYTIKAAAKRAILKTAEATGDLIGNKIANQHLKISRKCLKKIAFKSR